MLEKIINWLKKTFFYSLFNKVFFMFFVLVMSAGILLLMSVFSNLKGIKYEQTMDMSNQILASLDGFMEGKIESEKALYRKIRKEKQIWKAVLQNIETEDEQVDLSKIYKNIFESAQAIDRQFSGVYVAALDSEKVFSISDVMEAKDYYFFEKQINRLREKEDFSSFIVTSRENHLNQDYSVFILDTIHSENDFTEDIGILGVCFHIRNMRNAYENLENYLKGQVYVLNGNGTIIFDSGTEFAQEDIPFSEMEGKRKTVFSRGNYVYNSVYNQHQNIYFLNRIPKDSINQEAKTICNKIVQVMSVTFLVMVIMAFIGTHHFSQRFQSIEKVIRRAAEGKFTGYEKEKKVNDEIGYVYGELLSMCASLNRYIEWEYIYRLHQKEMELYTLQAQINPHFLYNTLEAIRMNLYVKGDKEASQMVYMLSEMFRNIMKKGPVVTLKEEFGYVKSYLELHRLRLGERMKYEFVVAEEVYHYATVKYILQPIIENVVIHGIQDMATEEEPAMVRIWAWKDGEDIFMGVEDNGVGIPVEKLEEIQKKLEGEKMFHESIGIYNVNNRLRIVYGNNYRLKIASEEGKGTAVTLKLRAMTKKELEKYVQDNDS